MTDKTLFVIRPADWIKTSHNNQNNPQSDITIGQEESYLDPIPPTVFTNTASNVSGASATLNATVNPNGFTTTAYFQWGADISYGNTTQTQSSGDGTANVFVAENLSGLSPATTYHYRIVADNVNGTSYGEDVVFTTTSSITWTNGSGDYSATNPQNWAGGVVPQNGDDLVFNGTSTDNCTWNLAGVIPRSLSIMSAYTGTVTLGNDLSMTGNLTISGGTLNLNAKNLDVDGFLLIFNSGTLDATSSTITVQGDWANWGNFIYGTSTVILDGTNQTIYGDTTFYNLTKTVTATDILYFEEGSTQTIVNNLTLQGAANNLLSLRSLSEGIQWYLKPQGGCNISFTSIKDLKNVNFVNIVTTNSENSGNNSGVSFGGSECVCLNEKLTLAQAIMTSGGGYEK